MCTKTCKEFPNNKSFDDKPDLADDYFGLIARYLRFLPTVILQSNTLVVIKIILGETD